MKFISDIIKSKRDEIKDLYFEAVSHSYKHFIYQKCYLNEETEEILLMNFKSEAREPKKLYNGKYHRLFTIGPNYYDDELTKYENIENLTSKEYLENNFSKSLDFEILFNMLIQDKEFEDLLISRIYIKGKFDISYNSPEEYIEDISKYYTIIKIDNGWIISNYDDVAELYYDKIKRHINKSKI